MTEEDFYGGSEREGKGPDVTEQKIMNAVRWHGRNDVRVEQIPVPSRPKAGELLLAVSYAGVCGTDIEEWLEGPINIPSSPNPSTQQAAPLTLGHEFCGEVIEAGADTAFQRGDRVTVEVNLTCGNCPSCLRGETQLCPELGSLGLHGDGGLAEQVLVPARVCVKIPDELCDEEAVLAEPLAVVVRTARLVGFQPGQSVVVLGGGTVGQLASRYFQRHGSDVVIVERRGARREIAQAANVPAFPGDAAPDEILGALGAPTGADIVIECVGYPGAVADAVRLVRPGGTVAVLGVSSHSLELSAWDLIGREIRLQAVLSHTMADFAMALDAIAQGLPTRDLITSVVPLSRAVPDVFGPRSPDAPTNLKVLVRPDTR